MADRSVMQRQRAAALIAALGAATSLGSCRALVAGCTEIGCIDGIVVEFQGGPAGVPITTAATGDGIQRTVPACTSSGGPCIATFDGFHPSQVTLEFSWEGGGHTVTITPQYQVVNPNGADCPPECVSAHIEVVIP